jgi:hypothetical protein
VVVTTGQLPEQVRPFKVPDSKPLISVVVAACSGEAPKKTDNTINKIMRLCLCKVFKIFNLIDNN